MSASAWNTGPVDAWVGIGSTGGPVSGGSLFNPGSLTSETGGQPVFLGHSKDGFAIRLRPQYEDVLADLWGRRVPADRIYQGADAVVSGTLARWDEKVHAALGAYADAAGAYLGRGPQRGTDEVDDRGTLVLSEGRGAFCLWLRYPRPNLPGPLAFFPNLFRVLPAGYRFPGATVEGPDELRPGAKPYEVSLVFRALAVDNNDGSLTLYDHDMGALPVKFE